MLILVCTSLLAFYLAWNLGANDVANSMGTSVGSKAVSLRQALVIAAVLEFSGALLLGQRVSQTLAISIMDPAQLTATPEVLLLGMVAVLLACGLWMNLATLWGLPVSSSHAIVGAIAGFAWCALGPGAIHWSFIGLISVTWVITPVISGAIAALYYHLVKSWILDAILDAIAARQRLLEWLPWLSTLLVATCGVLVLPQLLTTRFATVHLVAVWPFSLVSLELAIGAIAILVLTLALWPKPLAAQDALLPASISIGPDSKAGPVDQPPSVEATFARLQLSSACLVAFAHGSNDVGNAIAPLATISYILHTHTVPTAGLVVPLWILGIGGLGIVAGLAVWGKHVILTIGEGITALQPSGGFCAELATATTVLLASHVGLPVSTSHALVGAVVGVGLVREWRSVQGKTLVTIGQAWLVTIPVAAGLSAGLFVLGRGLCGL
jgi:inorganic phosphate transporter, PiT family